MMIFKGRNRVTSGFRLSARPSHNGIDLVGDDDRTVHAVAGGTVGFAGIVPKSAGGLTWQWGYYVRIDGNDGRKYYYCHLAAGSLLVRAGQRVQAGTALGTMGNTGYSFGAHTHFEVRNAYGTAIDPASYAGVRNAVGTYADTTDKEDGGMKFLKVLSEKCEVFSAADVNAVDKSYNGGRLKVDEHYPIQAEVGSDGTYTWVRIQAGAESAMPWCCPTAARSWSFPPGMPLRPAWRRPTATRQSWKNGLLRQMPAQRLRISARRKRTSMQPRKCCVPTKRT